MNLSAPLKDKLVRDHLAVIEEFDQKIASLNIERATFVNSYEQIVGTPYPTRGAALKAVSRVPNKRVAPSNVASSPPTMHAGGVRHHSPATKRKLRAQAKARWAKIKAGK